jgi:hypothetical protein
MPLDKEFVEEYLAKAKGFTAMGIPIENLTKEELIAIAIAGWEEYHALLMSNINSLESLKLFNKKWSMF